MENACKRYNTRQKRKSVESSPKSRVDWKRTKRDSICQIPESDESFTSEEEELEESDEESEDSSPTDLSEGPDNEATRPEEDGDEGRIRKPRLKSKSATIGSDSSSDSDGPGEKANLKRSCVINEDDSDEEVAVDKETKTHLKKQKRQEALRQLAEKQKSRKRTTSHETSEMSVSENENFIREFIEKYETLPCLWRIKSADYSNKIIKQKAHKELVDLVKKHCPSERVDVNVVKKKIQGLTTVFKEELKKVEDSQRIGAGTADIYVPRLWYYNLLLFTRDQELPRPSTSMLALQEEDLEANPPETQETIIEYETMAGPSSTPSIVAEDPDEGVENPPTPSITMRLFSRRKRKTSTPARSSDLFGLCHNIIEKYNRPLISDFAHYVDEKLQKVTEVQREHAKRVIIDVVRAARGGLLTTSSSFPVVEQPGPSSVAHEAYSHTSELHFNEVNQVQKRQVFTEAK
ncbi:coiled-coil domain-containing protein 82 isoform 1-T1 [Anomaloglossus baeobatrachus]|uniref:coiled-coil domain-containing protein 82 isoform X1 n=1 Tax=Anomaloglossus baeobatrachus TaxID=238106 RepID=UPI003F4FCF44